MHQHLTSRRLATREALAVTAVAAAAGLVACGSTTAGGAGQPGAGGTARASASAAAVIASAGVPLCVDARKVDRFILRLTLSQPREMLPRAITVTNVARARALAAALCGLPPVAHGRDCPAMPTGPLQLVFTAGGRDYRPVRIQDAGCPSVRGVGPTRQWAWSARPGRLLSEAVGGKGRLIPGSHPSSVPTA
jgi:hypothetical protein